MQRARSRWWGNQTHVIYTIVVFVVLASLDNSALAMIPFTFSGDLVPLTEVGQLLQVLRPFNIFQEGR